MLRQVAVLLEAQPDLPRVEMVHVLDQADQTCPQCGGTLRPMAGQAEDAEEITVVERLVTLVTHKRQKYRCAWALCRTPHKAHVRRKFVEAEPHYPVPCGEALAPIGQL